MQIIKFDEVNSTQEYLKNIVTEEEIVVCATTQTGGRGRRGNKWMSPLGGLWFSFNRQMPDNIKEVYTLGVGIAVLMALKEFYNENFLLKWPNDILLNNKKVCGIICEAVLDKVIVGIGINTNFDRKELKELGAISDTLQSITGKTIDNDKLLETILKNVIKIESYAKENIINMFRENMALVGEKRYITSIEKEAIILGIDDDGRLIVEVEGNQEKITGGNILNT